eukprot:582376-Karenia_brevis.AAC.1
MEAGLKELMAKATPQTPPRASNMSGSSSDKFKSPQKQSKSASPKSKSSPKKMMSTVAPPWLKLTSMDQKL